MSDKFIKVRFASKKHGHTAGIVFTKAFLHTHTMGELSQSWPYSEMRKMEWFEASGEFDTWEEAFYAEISSVTAGIVEEVNG